MAEAKRKSGLGKGLASLIPTGPAKPQIGNDAADVIFGAPRSGGDAEPSWYSLTKSPHRDQDDHTGGDSSDQGDTNHSRTKAGLPKNRPTPGQRAAAERKGSTRDHARATSRGPRGLGTPQTTTTPGTATPSTGQSKNKKAAPNPLISDDTATYRELPLPTIIRNEKNPRHEFDQEALRELAHSIHEFGLLQPIVVREASEPGRFELIMGERRLRAAQLAGLDTIPSIVREAADDTMLRDALLENIHRVQLNPLEEGAAYQQLLEEFGVTQAELATRLGRSRPVISNTIRLLQLPVPVQRRVAAGVLSAGHARALMGITQGANAQAKLAERIVAEGLSVRATEEAVTLINRDDNEPTKKEQHTPRPQPEKLTHWADSFGDYLDTNVKVHMGAKKGKIVVEFAGMEDFDRIIAMLKSQGTHTHPTQPPHDTTTSHTTASPETEPR